MRLKQVGYTSLTISLCHPVSWRLFHPLIVRICLPLLPYTPLGVTKSLYKTCLTQKAYCFILVWASNNQHFFKDRSLSSLSFPGYTHFFQELHMCLGIPKGNSVVPLTRQPWLWLWHLREPAMWSSSYLRWLFPLFPGVFNIYEIEG